MIDNPNEAFHAGAKSAPKYKNPETRIEVVTDARGMVLEAFAGSKLLGRVPLPITGTDIRLNTLEPGTVCLTFPASSVDITYLGERRVP